MKNGGYGIVYREILRDKTLSSQARLIYSYLCSFAGNTGVAYPSANLIMTELSMSKDTFYKYLRELKERGIIKVERKRSNSGKFTRNIYYLNNSPYPNISDMDNEPPCPNISDMVKTQSNPDNITIGTDSPCPSLPDTVNQDTNSNSINNKKNSNRASISSSKKDKKTSNKDIEIFFESIWKLYPRKKGKGKVSQSKKNKLYGIGLEHLTRAIERYKQETRDTEVNFIMHGSTFFNTGYVDYLDENYTVDKKIENEIDDVCNINRQY